MWQEARSSSDPLLGRVAAAVSYVRSAAAALDPADGEQGERAARQVWAVADQLAAIAVERAEQQTREED